MHKSPKLSRNKDNTVDEFLLDLGIIRGIFINTGEKLANKIAKIAKLSRNKANTADEFLLNLAFCRVTKGCKSCRAYKILEYVFAEISNDTTRTSRSKFAKSWNFA